MVVNIVFDTSFRVVERKRFSVSLVLRLSKSMNIVETTRQSLQSLKPPFKSFAEDAVAELTQLLTEDGFSSHSVVPTDVTDHYTITSEFLVQLTTSLVLLSDYHPDTQNKSCLCVSTAIYSSLGTPSSGLVL